MSKRLILNFDLNRTVLMSDAAGGRGMVDTLNYLLSEVSFGTATQSTWLAHTNTSPPPTNTINYKKYVDSQHPYIVEGQDPVPQGFASASAYNKVQKTARKNLHGTFTQHDQPGHPFVDKLNALVVHMQMPAAAKMRAADSETTGLLRATWLQGQHMLLPSFINLLFHIQDHATLMDQVHICYRTFGNDLAEVRQELQVLCAGTHPMYHGRKLDARFALRAPYSNFYRRGPLSQDCFLTTGTLERPSNIAATNEEIHAFYQQLKAAEKEESIATVSGYTNILQTIRDLVCAEPRRSVGIRDHWKYWAAHGESDDSGKVLLVDGSDCLQQIFIDDHVEDDHAHIVDVRDVARDGACVPFDRAIGKYMVRACPYDAICNPNYFIELVEGIVEREGGKRRAGEEAEGAGEAKKASPVSPATKRPTVIDRQLAAEDAAVAEQAVLEAEAEFKEKLTLTPTQIEAIKTKSIAASQAKRAADKKAAALQTKAAKTAKKSKSARAAAARIALRETALENGETIPFELCQTDVPQQWFGYPEAGSINAVHFSLDGAWAATQTYSNGTTIKTIKGWYMCDAGGKISGRVDAISIKDTASADGSYEFYVVGRSAVVPKVGDRIEGSRATAGVAMVFVDQNYSPEEKEEGQGL